MHQNLNNVNDSTWTRTESDKLTSPLALGLEEITTTTTSGQVHLETILVQMASIIIQIFISHVD